MIIWQLIQNLKSHYEAKINIGLVSEDDLMYTDDVETDTIDGEKYYTFQPNTIVCAVPVDSDLGKSINNSSIE